MRNIVSLISLILLIISGCGPSKDLVLNSNIVGEPVIIVSANGRLALTIYKGSLIVDEISEENKKNQTFILTKVDDSKFYTISHGNLYVHANANNNEFSMKSLHLSPYFKFELKRISKEDTTKVQIIRQYHYSDSTTQWKTTYVTQAAAKLKLSTRDTPSRISQTWRIQKTGMNRGTFEESLVIENNEPYNAAAESENGVRNVKILATADTQFDNEWRDSDDENASLLGNLNILLPTLKLSMNKYAKGLIVAGDLTMNTKAGEINDFYNKLGNYDLLYEGFGNHDMEDGNCCEGLKIFQQITTGMSLPMTAIRGCVCPVYLMKNISRTRKNVVQCGAVCIYYSWNIDGVHFVQLNYDIDHPSSEVFKYGLKTDLERHARNGNPVVLIIHVDFTNLNTAFVREVPNEIAEIIAPYNIVSIIHGHHHLGNTYQNENNITVPDGLLEAFSPNIEPRSNLTPARGWYVPVRNNYASLSVLRRNIPKFNASAAFMGRYHDNAFQNEWMSVISHSNRSDNTESDGYRIFDLQDMEVLQESDVVFNAGSPFLPHGFSDIDENGTLDYFGIQMTSNSVSGFKYKLHCDLNADGMSSEALPDLIADDITTPGNPELPWGFADINNDGWRDYCRFDNKRLLCRLVNDNHDGFDATDIEPFGIDTDEFAGPDENEPWAFSDANADGRADYLYVSENDIVIFYAENSANPDQEIYDVVPLVVDGTYDLSGSWKQTRGFADVNDDGMADYITTLGKPNSYIESKFQILYGEIVNEEVRPFSKLSEVLTLEEIRILIPWWAGESNE